MQFLPPDELRRLCKDEKSFRELNEMVLSFLAISGAGEGKEYWAAYLEHCSDLVLEINETGKVIAVPSTGKSTGKKQFVGRNLKLLVPISLAEKLQSAVQKVFENQEPEKLFLGKETETPFLILSPVVSAGKINSVLAIFPVAKFKSGIKRRLNESERKYRYLFEHANDSILITDPETHIIIDANSVAAKELGYSIQELLGMKIEAITAPEYEADLPAIRENLFSKGYSIFEAVHMDKTGKRIPVEVSSRKISYDGIPAYLNFVRNISDRKKAEDLLVRKGHELDAFLYRSSHDLKGPIATIRGLLLVAGMEVTDPDARYYFDLLQKAATKLDTNLVDLIQITTIKHIQPSISKIDLNELVAEVMHKLSADFDINAYHLELHISKNLKHESDRSMLRNILLQLLSNAMKYSFGMDRDPSIVIRIGATKNGIEISVTDNGIGIPLEAREKIFDLFFRANTKISGNGLGLTILRNIVQKLEGEISLESEVAQGTNFRVNLPTLMTKQKTSLRKQKS